MEDFDIGRSSVGGMDLEMYLGGFSLDDGFKGSKKIILNESLDLER